MYAIFSSLKGRIVLLFGWKFPIISQVNLSRLCYYRLLESLVTFTRKQFAIISNCDSYTAGGQNECIDVMKFNANIVGVLSLSFDL